MSSAPLWRQFDPLPILAGTVMKKPAKNEKGQDTGDSDDVEVEDMFGSDAVAGSRGDAS